VFKVAALALAAGAAAIAQAAERIDARAAAEFVGQTKRVCGPVAGLRRPDVTDRSPTLFDLVAPHPDQAVTISVSSQARRAFASPVEDRATALDLCASGRIDKTDAGLVVKVDDARLLVGVTRRPREPFFPDLPRPAQGASDGLVGPRVVRSANPKYTPEAMRARIEGLVHIEAVIREDGTVGDTRVIQSIDALFGLDEAAVRAFRLWRFEPATRFGRPAAAVVVGVLRFDLY